MKQLAKMNSIKQTELPLGVRFSKLNFALKLESKYFST